MNHTVKNYNSNVDKDIDNYDQILRRALKPKNPIIIQGKKTKLKAVKKFIDKKLP